MSPLRQRMLEDMAMRGLREDTQRDYVRFVRSFAAFLRRPPDTATAEGYSPRPGPPGREWCAATEHQLLCVGTAILLRGDSPMPPSRTALSVRQRR